jgi:UDP-2,3-diacylglucosamine pyrophosphatase LpxH
MQKRKVDVVVISDVHLGTFGCHAKELLDYLNSIEPQSLILNGDIVDIWNFRKHYWPDSHMAIIKKIMEFVATGVSVMYLTGNHDELLRRFSGLKLGNFQLKDRIVLDLNGEKCWIFHGDVFDVTMRHSKWLARLGAVGYDMLILINRFVNFLLEKAGRSKISLSKRIKDSVKSAINFVDDFERTATDIAIENGYKYVICGHIHKPQVRSYTNESGSCIYLNSGDWVENLTALEFADAQWSLHRYQQAAIVPLRIHTPSQPTNIGAPNLKRELEVA